MSKTQSLRNDIVEQLRGTDREMAVVNIDGNYFSAADIAIKNQDGSIDTYRIAVVKSNLDSQKS